MVRYDKSTADKGAGYVQDRRDGRRTGAPGGGGRRSAGVIRPVGLGGVLIVIVASLLGFGELFGGSSGSILETQGAGLPQSDGVVEGQITTVDPEADTREYMNFLMYDIQQTWDGYFTDAGRQYEPTGLVIFDDVVSTGCGQATSAVGPFYCPAPNDHTVYIDFAFFQDLASPRFGAAGDFAQAYVIAHEVGHHVQSLLGISDAVNETKRQDPASANELSIRLELQADCMAGIWAYSANQRLTEESGQPIIEGGDIEEGLTAAASVGDDRIQASSTGFVNEETWTHGSSAQRVEWFRVGFDSGDPEMCDTFSADI